MSKSAPEPVLAITPGEPAGIGPDLITRLDPATFSNPLLAIANLELLDARAKQLGVTPPFHLVTGLDEVKTDVINVLNQPIASPAVAGKPDPANGQYVIDCLETAVQLCESGACAAMITGPVNKAVINESGTAFTGHTEWLAERLNTPKVVMMLASGDLRVALVTTHLPLRKVADAITETEVATTLEILHRDLREKFSIAQPNILVCGLNPHAGEGGHLGTEEIEIIDPVLTRARQNGMRLVGPLPADTAFTRETLRDADAVLAMYHDQGLPVLKHHAFGDAINITLGLPIIRTSVDHGTAFDIAGTGRADPGSLVAAITLASQLANRSLRS
ncbi:MAG: 4-hydroxythreonine-4-phosphate dehydrogenase PdxA [Pseudomonadales bacterium]